jgi:hypothetical protein
MITETGELRAAIDAAAIRWPDLADNRAALVRRLILIGARSGAEEQAQRRLEFAAAVDAASGSMTGIYPPGAARRLAEEWPE